MERLKNKQTIYIICISITIRSLQASLASSSCDDMSILHRSFNVTLDFCKEYLTKDCTAFSRTYDMSLLPEDSMRGRTVPTPDEFVVTELFQSFTPVDRPGLLFRWKSPSSSSANNSTKGFYLRIESRDTKPIDCRIFSIRHPDYTLQFLYTIPVLSDNGPHYIVKIYSLPLSSNRSEINDKDNSRSTIVTVNKPHLRSDFPGGWKAGVSVTPSSEERSIDVHFSLPNQILGYGFTDYAVHLVRVHINPNKYFRAEYVYVPIKHTLDTGHTRFTNVPLEDVYQVSVQAKDPHPHVLGKCLCYRNVTSFHGNNTVCEHSCAISKSAIFDLEGDLNYDIHPTTSPKPTIELTSGGEVSAQRPDGNDTTIRSLLYTIVVLLSFWHNSL